MPTIEISHRDLNQLLGKEIPLKKLRDQYILYAKGEVEEVAPDGDTLKVDIKDTNRPDLWSTEGIAREIAGRLGRKGLPKYKVSEPQLQVKVDQKVEKVRPYTVCAVVKNLNIDQATLAQMIQLQEKVSLTFGRSRREVAIGAYDLDRLQPPIKYTTVEPDGIKFMPLEFNRNLTPKEILKQHPKGKEFGHLLEGKKEYPIFLDSEDNVLSVPPIINSDYTGKVTQKTRNLFIECSGFHFRFLKPALNVLVTALADRGGKLGSVKIVYPDQNLITPDLAPKEFSVDPEMVREVSGLELKDKKIVSLLEQARYSAELKDKKIILQYPAYRQDIMHPRDVVEDAIISSGYNRIKPRVPEIPTIGKSDESHLLIEDLSKIMLGLGYQEVLSYTLTNRENLFQKMNSKPEKVVEVANPISLNWSVFRTWLLPGLLEFLSRNKHVSYPQRIFEIGDCVKIDRRRETRTRDIKKMTAVFTDTEAGYEDISSVLDAFLRNSGVSFSLKKYTHPSFIKGRTAAIYSKKQKVGVMGEAHPQVLNNWNLEKPTVAFELNLTRIFPQF